MKGYIMKIIVFDPNGVVTRIERDIRDFSNMDFESACEDMSEYIDNDCVVTFYVKDYFNKNS